MEKNKLIENKSQKEKENATTKRKMKEKMKI